MGSALHKGKERVDSRVVELLIRREISLSRVHRRDADAATDGKEEKTTEEQHEQALTPRCGFLPCKATEEKREEVTDAPSREAYGKQSQ